MDYEKAYVLLSEKVNVWLVEFVKNIPNFVIAILIVIIFWLVSSLFSTTSKRFMGKFKNPNLALEGLVIGVLKIAIIMLGFVVALSILGLDKAVFSLLAGIGVVGLALGFALKDLVSNLVSGITIAVAAPIRIGDHITINNFTGFVEQINLRDTVVRDFNGQLVTIPNQDFMTNPIINFSRLGRRRTTIDLGIAYSDNPEKVRDIILTYIKSNKDILQDPSPAVDFTGFGASSVNLAVKYWISYPGQELMKIQNDVSEFILGKSVEEEFSIPFPIRTLEYSDVNSDSLKKDI